MPWKTNRNGKRVYERIPLPPVPTEDSPQDEKDVFAAAFRRYIRVLPIDWLDMYGKCPRKACRRSNSCTSPIVECNTGETFRILHREFYRPLGRAFRKAYPHLKRET